MSGVIRKAYYKKSGYMYYEIADPLTSDDINIIQKKFLSDFKDDYTKKHYLCKCAAVIKYMMEDERKSSKRKMKNVSFKIMDIHNSSIPIVKLIVKGGWGKFFRDKYRLNTSGAIRYDWKQGKWTNVLFGVTVVSLAILSVAASAISVGSNIENPSPENNIEEPQYEPEERKDEPILKLSKNYGQKKPLNYKYNLCPYNHGLTFYSGEFCKGINSVESLQCANCFLLFNFKKGFWGCIECKEELFVICKLCKPFEINMKYCPNNHLLEKENYHFKNFECSLCLEDMNGKRLQCSACKFRICNYCIEDIMMKEMNK